LRCDRSGWRSATSGWRASLGLPWRLSPGDGKGRGTGLRLSGWRQYRRSWSNEICVGFRFERQSAGRAAYRNLLRGYGIEPPILQGFALRADERFGTSEREDRKPPIRFDYDPGEPEVGQFLAAGVLRRRGIRWAPGRTEQRPPVGRRKQLLLYRLLPSHLLRFGFCLRRHGLEHRVITFAELPFNDDQRGQSGTAGEQQRG